MEDREARDGGVDKSRAMGAMTPRQKARIRAQEAPGDTLKQRAVSRQQRHREKRRDEGWCGREGCPNWSGPEHYYCRVHIKSERMRSRASREKARAEAKASQPRIAAILVFLEPRSR